MKKVVWAEGKYSSQTAGNYRSFGEFAAKHDARRAEQEKATSYLLKAMPAMLKALEMRISSGQPLYVMRPLRYTTSMLKSQLEDDLDKSFYNTSKTQGNDSFVTTVRVINPGTQLILKSLDPHMKEFIFNDGEGKEHAISYDDRNALMTQTDIFEMISKLFEGKGE